MIQVIDKNKVFDTRIDTNKIYVSMKTTFIPRVYKNNLAKLYLHITGHGTRNRVNLDIEIPMKYWDAKKQRINVLKNPSENEQKKLQDLNLIIDNVDAKITNIKTVYRLTEQVLNPIKLQEELINDLPRVKFCSYFMHVIEEEKTKLKPGTIRKLTSVCNKLKEYDEHIIFTDLTLNWFDNYKNHLYKIGNQKTTVNSNIISIKKILRLAIKSGIKIPCNLDDIKSGSTLGNKISLEPLEIKKIHGFYESQYINETHKLMLGYFLFSCVTGMRFSDVMGLTRESVSDKSVQFESRKTKKIQTITLNKAAKKLLEGNARLFVDKFTNEYINRELKVIMRSLAIKKKISFHISRHTFATSFLRAGGKVEKLQKLLGHSDIRTSMIYSHILETEANKDMGLLDDLF